MYFGGLSECLFFFSDVQSHLMMFMCADTEEEKDKFFDDALALATDLTDGQTFADVLPVMNFWAGFSASAEVCGPLYLRISIFDVHQGTNLPFRVELAWVEHLASKPYRVP
jgi:hypothetical protein